MFLPYLCIAATAAIGVWAAVEAARSREITRLQERVRAYAERRRQLLIAARR